MSKIIILGDLHLGASQGNVGVWDKQMDFFSNCLVPYMKEHNITRILQLGDFFDNRKFLHLPLLHRLNEQLIPLLESVCSRMDVLIGNHDIPWSSTLDGSSIDSVFGTIPWVNIIKTGTILSDTGRMVLGAVPWICPASEEGIWEFISQNQGDMLFGHFDIAQANMNGFSVSQHGVPFDKFGRWDKVISGHFHHRGTYHNGALVYTGTPYDLTWGDIGQDRGFWVLDTDVSRDSPDLLQFVPNPFKLHSEIVLYGDSDIQIPKHKIKGTWVRVNIKGKVADKTLNKVIRLIEAKEPHEIRVFDLQDQTVSVASSEMLIHSKDTREYISEATRELVEINNVPDPEKFQASVVARLQELYDTCSQMITSKDLEEVE